VAAEPVELVVVDGQRAATTGRQEFRANNAQGKSTN
jgi:hypothetical protein